ncbi:MAG: helix-turn-helix domain-containing protein [Janthinobacterium lividum]
MPSPPPKELAELYAKVAPAAGAAAQPLETPPEIGHFNVFNVANLMQGYRTRAPMNFSRRAFYKISLLRGRGQIEYADQAVAIEHQVLWFATHRVPYRWLPHDLAQAGYFCVFTAEFLPRTKAGLALDELPVFQPGGCPVLPLTDADYAAIELIFEKMAREITSDYAYKYDLLHTYLEELIHYGQKLQPAPSLVPARTAGARVAAQFAELLERQFPLDMPQQQLGLRTARDFAGQLAVHVNHLNRVLKDATGHTTTALISSRVAQEAKLLLKHSSWTVAEIADSLGFTDTAHFCHFFKRQTGRPPGTFRA